MSSEWTQDEADAMREALSIIASLQFAAGSADGSEKRMSPHLRDFDSAARIAIGAVDVCGLLLAYIDQTQNQYREMLTPLLDHLQPNREDRAEDGFIKTPAEILAIIAEAIPDPNGSTA